MRIVNTRRWPSIEMQEQPGRYKWTPAEAPKTPDVGKKSR
jgi:hypothetical protein